MGSHDDVGLDINGRLTADGLLGALANEELDAHSGALANEELDALRFSIFSIERTGSEQHGARGILRHPQRAELTDWQVLSAYGGGAGGEEGR